MPGTSRPTFYDILKESTSKRGYNIILLLLMLKNKKIDDVRYYLYVSDTKLNMLFEQLFSIENNTKHMGASINVGIAAASLESSSQSSVDRDG